MGAVNVGIVPLRREVVIIAVLFVVGAASGLYFGKVLAGEPRSAPTDYAVLVARLFENDQDKDLATSRLKAGGVEKPSDAVATIAAGYPTGTTDQARDAEALRKLSRALGVPASGTLAGGGLPTTYILIGLVGLTALALIALLAIRILGLRVPSLPKAPTIARSTRFYGRPQGSAPPADGTPPPAWTAPDAARMGLAEPADAVVETHPPAERKVAPVKPAQSVSSASGSSVRTRPMQAGDAAAVNGAINGKGRSNGRSAPPIQLRPNQLRAVPPPQGYSFRSSYRLGDEPYDEIHPISGDSGRALVGACGVSAARFLTEHGQKRYWAFTAWLHDYASDGQFRAVGLVSRWASDHFADEIDDWRNEGDIDEVKLVDFDEQIPIETAHLSATLSIEDVDYIPGVPPEAIFNRLAAQFDVEVRRASGSQDGQAV